MLGPDSLRCAAAASSAAPLAYAPLAARLDRSPQALEGGLPEPSATQPSEMSPCVRMGDSFQGRDTGHEAPRVPLSIADRLSLTPCKKQRAQAFYEVGRELAARVTGDAESFHYGGVGLTNVDEIASLWALQARQGDLKVTLRSVPATLLAAAAGTLANVPIEGARIEAGRVTEVRAAGHSLNPLLNACTTLAAGAALAAAPGLAAVAALAGPLLTVAPLLAQRLGETNAPVHEMAHATQMLLAGDLLHHGVIDTTDLMAIQNDVGATGYLWGGSTERAARAAEVSGDIKPLFEVLRERVAARLEERYAHAAQPLLDEATRRLDAHEAWMAQALAQRLEEAPRPPAPTSSSLDGR